MRLVGVKSNRCGDGCGDQGTVENDDGAARDPSIAQSARRVRSAANPMEQHIGLGHGAAHPSPGCMVAGDEYAADIFTRGQEQYIEIKEFATDYSEAGSKAQTEYKGSNRLGGKAARLKTCERCEYLAFVTSAGRVWGRAAETHRGKRGCAPSRCNAPVMVVSCEAIPRLHGCDGDAVCSSAIRRRWRVSNQARR